jgi:outer membrane receptor protein involved in Fe transport
MNEIRTVWPLVGAILSLTTVPSVSTAQNQAVSAAHEGFEEVVVTARRREESAQSVPIAITALGGAELEARHINNLEAVQSAVPEFSISQSSGRPNSPVYGLRGIRPTEAIYGQDPTVAVYFADVVISPAEGTNLGLYDLASVQVLKGPQGTLFGTSEELLFAASASYRSHVWINALQTIAAIRRTPDSVLPFLQQAAYTLVDLNASWNRVMGSALDVAVYVKNVTDKEYAVGGIQLYESSYQAISRFGLVTKAYGEPRTFGAEVRYRF